MEFSHSDMNSQVRREQASPLGTLAFPYAEGIAHPTIDGALVEFLQAYQTCHDSIMDDHSPSEHDGVSLAARGRRPPV
jgi:hypothetical protein